MNLQIKKRLSRKEIEALPYLIESYSPFLVTSGAVSNSAYIKYFINKIDDLLRQNKKSRLLIIKNREILGVSLLKFMEWDSNFFRMPIGCIEYILADESKKNIKEANKIAKELLKNSINLARELGMRILYMTIDSRRYSLVNTLNSLGFNFVCSEIKGIIRKKDMRYPCLKEKVDGKYKFRKYKKDDYPQIINIAEEISKDLKSKFSLTPYLPRKEKYSYYLENIRNCCLGLNADDIFVAAKNGVVVGFVCYRYDRIFEKTLRKKIAFSVIGGVSPLERRKGIGSHLFNWSYKQIFKNSEAILWKIHLHNLPMIRFILKRGFVPSLEILYTFCRKL